jgi:hypothetical protein
MTEQLLVGRDAVGEVTRFSLDRFAAGRAFGASNSNCLRV